MVEMEEQMPYPDWNQRYAEGDIPWDAGQPSEHLVEMVETGSVPSGRALVVGCGTGTNAVWLAERGYEVLGVDVAPLAVEQARTRAEEAGVAKRCRFERLDFLDEKPSEGEFDLVFDRGCFHIFDLDEERGRFAERVAAALGPAGVWLSLIGSTEGPPRDTGPPRRTAREVVEAIEPALELLSLRGTWFSRAEDAPPRAWICRSGTRDVPAQPSTRRD